MAFTVADSGGTGTSLAFYRSDDDIIYLETKALHPKFLLKWGEEELDEMRRSLPGDLSSPLFFYGAGCSQPGVAYDVKLRLQKIGFSGVTVFSDALGACRACCGNNPGLVAILGTGSVLLDYSGEEITKIVGGLGSLAGDEGSGFYFGKMLLKYLFSGKLSDEMSARVTELIGNESSIRAQLASGDSLQFISQLAGKVADLELDEVHTANIESFISSHLQNYTGSTVNFVGSYAWFQREKIGHMLAEKGIKTGLIIRNPISQLVKFHSELI